MNQLIRIDCNSDRPTASARELHEFLEVGTHFKDWFPRMCEYGFVQGEDFNPLKIEQVQIEGAREVIRTITDYQITIPMAKELSMIQRTEKGKMARQYFIRLEEAWNSPEQVMARALRIADRRINKLQSTIEEQKPKVLFADAVSASHTSILIGDLAKLIRQNGFQIGQNRLFSHLRDTGFLIKSGSSRNMPTQRAMEMGLFEVKETTISNPDGSIRITKTPKVTGKGQIYFINQFMIREVTKEAS